MHFHKFPGNGQPDTAALVQYIFGHFALEKGLEYALPHFGGNADPCILNLDLQQRMLLFFFGDIEFDGYLPILRGEFKCIGQKIEQDALDLVMIERSDEMIDPRPVGKADILFVRQIGKGIRGLFYEIRDIPLCLIQPELIDFHFSEIEQLIDEIQQSSRISFDQQEGTPDRRILGALYQLVHGRQDKGQRGSELVADIGQEFDIHHVQLVHPQGLLPLLGQCKPGFRPPDNEEPRKIQQGDQQQHIKEIGQGGLPERRQDDDPYRDALVIPYTVAIRSLYAKPVFARIYIRINGPPRLPVRYDPILIEIFQFVCVLVLFCVGKTQRGKTQGKIIFIIT